jgi:hypothetical protein
MSLAIVNSSTMVTDKEGQLIVNGINMLLPKFCSDWSLPTYIATYVPKGRTTSAPYIVYLLDNTDVAGVVGYHEEVSDVAYAKCFVQTILSNKGVVLYSPNKRFNTVAKCVSHEVFELLLDPKCNGWWDIGDGRTFYAQEACDPIQNNVVVLNVQLCAPISVYNAIDKKFVTTPAVKALVGFSDWILPAWSDPQETKGPFNHLNTLSAPFTLDTGGYAINMTCDLGNRETAMTFGKEVTDEQKNTYRGKARIAKRTI